MGLGLIDVWSSNCAFSSCLISDADQGALFNALLKDYEEAIAKIRAEASGGK
jgi:hypothetical protein